MAPLVFPSPGLQVLSLLVHFLGLAVLTHCLSHRLALSTASSWSGFRQLSWPRLCVIIIFLDSWLFLFSSGVLIFGVGIEATEGACSAAITLCIVFYATSKVFIYAFLAEKVYIVWSPATGVRRFKSPIYLICFITVSIYTIVIALMVAGRIYFRRPGDDACVVGLKPISSIPLLTFDLYINISLTALFLWPLLRTRMLNLRVKTVAIRTLIAASVALTTSTANVVVLAAFKGRELGWICLCSCAGDVIVNALAIFWVTSGSGGNFTQSSISGPIVMERRLPQFNKGLDVLVSNQSGQNLAFDHQSITKGGKEDTSSPRYPSAVLASGPTHGVDRNTDRGALSALARKPLSRSKPAATLFREEPIPPAEHELELRIKVTTQSETDHQVVSPPVNHRALAPSISDAA